MHPMLRHYAYHAIFAAAAAGLALFAAGVWAIADVGAPVWPSLLSGGDETAWSHSDELSVLVLIITATGMFVALYGFAIGRILVALKRDRITDVQGGGWQLMVPSVLALFTCAVLGVLLQVLFWLVAAASVWPLLAAWRVARPFQPPKIRD
jgi:hypothetical protein